MPKKVSQIANAYNYWGEDSARALWEAASKVIDIPEWDAITGWLAGGPMPTLREQVNPHNSGPSIGLMHDAEGPRGVYVITDVVRDDRCSIELLHDRYDNWDVIITFRPTSERAEATAEAILQCLGDKPPAAIEVVYADGTGVDLPEVDGPVRLPGAVSRMPQRYISLLVHKDDVGLYVDGYDVRVYTPEGLYGRDPADYVTAVVPADEVEPGPEGGVFELAGGKGTLEG